MTTNVTMETLWRNTWPAALACWSAYTQLREPTFFEHDKQAKNWGMAGQLAAIRLHDQAVMVNLEQIAAKGLSDLALPILAHEIGHHVYVPGNLADNARMIAAIRPVLFGLAEDTAHLVANLYGDLLINDRLERRAEVDVSGVYRKLNESVVKEGGESSLTWRLYTRTYEYLWRMQQGTLSPPGVTAEMEADAALIARLIRHYAAKWLGGARRFACILYPYLQADEEARRSQTFQVLGLCDTKCAGSCRGGGRDVNAIPGGIIGFDPAEFGDEDEFDKELADIFGESPPDGATDKESDQPHNRHGRRTRGKKRKALNEAPMSDGKGSPRRQFREPFEYGELLRALGLNLAEHEVTTRYYRERALPHLVPFPTKPAPQAKEPLPEGYYNWEPGESLEDLDLFGSLMQSPLIIPGVTTVQRVYGETPGSDPQRLPLDLDIYVDCSGSMPHPAVNVSYLALAGTILALSALRVGARVQATLWSGAGQFDTTGGFSHDEKRILGIITGYLAGSTAFPLHVLRNTYEDRKPSEPAVHIVVISDEGVDTMLGQDELGAQGMAIAEQSLQAARGGGTLVLNLPSSNWAPRKVLEGIGFSVHRVRDWEQLVAFARAFVRENYATNR